MDYNYDSTNPWRSEQSIQSKSISPPSSPIGTNRDKNPFFDEMFFISNANDTKKLSKLKGYINRL